MPRLGPEGRHEDEAGDRRADVRDHVQQPRDHAEPEGEARAQQPRRHALSRPRDRRDHDDADRPPRDRLRHALPDPEPALVLAGHEHASERPLHVRDVAQEEQADEEDREPGQEDAEEVARDAQHGETASGTETDVLSAPSCRFFPIPVSPSQESSSEERSWSIVCGRSCRKSRTEPTIGTRKRSPIRTTADRGAEHGHRRGQASRPAGLPDHEAHRELEDEPEEDPDEDDQERVPDRDERAQDADRRRDDQDRPDRDQQLALLDLSRPCADPIPRGRRIVLRRCLPPTS